jgi:hypothetical protein
MAHSGSNAFSVGIVSLLLCQCGPYHEGGGSGGSSPVGGAAGSNASGSGGLAGAATSGTGGADVAGSAGSEVGGAAGSPTSPGTEAVIGCEAMTWPDAGSYFEAPPEQEFSDRTERLLARFTARGISGDGRVVVGSAPDLPYTRGLPLAWNAMDGLIELPTPPYETSAIQASCDGSVVLEQDVFPFQQLYRVEAGQEPLQVAGSPPGGAALADPSMSVIVNGHGPGTEFYTVPLRWTAATGTEELTPLRNNFVYHVAPDGKLLAADPNELYRYDVATDARTPVGMSPVNVNFGAGASLRASADGSAWVQTADLNYDSFLVWQPPAEPRSITCPTSCRVVDVSGTGQVALIDVSLGTINGPFSSWIWTLATGLVDLTLLFEQHGFDFHGQKLHAAAMSDDARAFAGNLIDESSTPSARAPFFHAVLPAAVYE